jgi:hypothetical protein
MEVFRRVRTELSLLDPIYQTEKHQETSISCKFSFYDLRFLADFLFATRWQHEPNFAEVMGDLFRLKHVSVLRGRGARCHSEGDLENSLRQYFIDILRFDGRDPLERLQPQLTSVQDTSTVVSKLRSAPLSEQEERFVNYILYHDALTLI